MELLTLKLTAPQIRSAVMALADTLDQGLNPLTADVRRQDELVESYLALVRAQMQAAGWRPQGINLSPWAVEALARVTAPLPAPKKAAAATKKPAAAPKRRRTDTRRRHDRPRTASTEVEPPLPMSDDVTEDISDEVLS